MINESTSTDPICAKHNGHHAFLQVLFLFPVEYLSSCQSFLCVDPHARCKFGSHPSFFILPSSDLVHQSHCTREHCFGLNINLSEKSHLLQMVCRPRRFPRILSVCILSFALLLGCVHIQSKLFSRSSPSCVSCVSTHVQFWGIVIRQAFRLHLPEQVPKTSFLSPFPWRLPGSADRPSGALKVDGKHRGNSGRQGE